MAKFLPLSEAELQSKNDESTVRDLRSNMLLLEDEVKRLKNNLQSSLHKCDNLESESKHKQLHINRQDEVIRDLQEKLQSKTHSIAELNQQIEFEAREKASWIADLNERIEFEIRQKESRETELQFVTLQLGMFITGREMMEKDVENLNRYVDNLKKQLEKLKAVNDLVIKYQKVIENEILFQDPDKCSAELKSLLEFKSCEAELNLDSELIVRDGIKQDIMEKLERHLVCSVCTEILIKPTVLGCTHFFCEFCIRKWRMNKNECPLCKKPAFDHALVPVLDQFINETLETVAPEQISKRNEFIKDRLAADLSWLQSCMISAREDFLESGPSSSSVAVSVDMDEGNIVPLSVEDSSDIEEVDIVPASVEDSSDIEEVDIVPT